MLTTDSILISELSDTELDSVAAGYGYKKQVAADNVALQLFTSNNQLNLAGANIFAKQGGGQTNNNNAGNQA